MKETKLAGLALAVGLAGASCAGFFGRFSQIPSLALVTLRMCTTVLLFTAEQLITGGWRQLRQLTRSQLGWCAAAGTALAINLVCTVEAVRNVNLAAANVLLTTEVIFVALISAVLGHKTDAKSWLLILTAFAGSTIIALASSTGDAGPRPIYGCMIALTATLMVSIYTLIGRKVRSSGVSTSCYTYVVYCCCCAVVLCLALAKGMPLLGLPAREYALGLGLAVCCTFLGHSMFSYALKYLYPAYVSAAKLLIPVITGLLAIPIFGEIPTPAALVGCVIVAASILCYTLREARAAKQPAPQRKETAS